MKTLVLDNAGDGCGIDLALRGQAAGHSIRYWSPARRGAWGDGMLEKPEEWEPSMDWAELIVLTGNDKYAEPLAPYFGKGYPIFGTNTRAAELELDRKKGQDVLKECGVAVLSYHTVDSIDDAIAFVKKNRKAYAIKPWGGTRDKAMTCVCKDADEAVFTLSKWKKDGHKGQLMLQEKVDGVEIGISGFFGPNGWASLVEESFEHKRFLVGDLGCNTGEMGTVIRHVQKSKLFDQVLRPVTDYLHQCNYIGDCSVNCIVDEDGNPWPLEFTMRLGWPDFCIRQALVVGDPLEWIADLVHGVDTFDTYEDIAVGVVITHGGFPREEDSNWDWDGYPLSGINKRNLSNVHFQEVREGKFPTADGEATGLVTAGNYLMVVTGTGETVSSAQKGAYDVAWKIKAPTNLMFRLDIGDRLRDDLPTLHRLGFARGMDF